MSTIELHILSSTTIQKYAVVWVEFTTPIGEFTIQPGHVPTTFTLKQNHMFVFRLTSGKQESVLINQGVVQITRTSVTVIVA